MKIDFHELNSVNDDLLKYAVIVTRYNQNWIFVRHKDRQTWEIPGGRREPNEEIIETMKRELFEETGAVEFEVAPVCLYSVERELEKSYGLLCYSEIKKLGEKLDYEIIEIREFSKLPNDLTYPNIQPKLFDEVVRIKNSNNNDMNPYVLCPIITTKSFTIRLIRASDSKSLFRCYNDKKAVEFMNDDNCDFGFFVDSDEKMQETIGYWIDFYQKQYFVRFSIVDNVTEEAIGTIEGFNGETGVLRVDICSEYEKACYLSELLNFARDNFYAFFGNEYLVTKAISKALERREALANNGWEIIDTYRDYHDYYRIKLI